MSTTPPRRGRRPWFAPLLPTMVAAVACGQSPGDEPILPGPGPDADARGTYLDVFLGDDARICPPTLERLDAEVERIADALDLEADPDDPIALYYGGYFVKELCGIEADVGDFVRGGCADGDGEWIAAQPGVEGHEIVHALRVRAGLFGPSYWEEGLATYLGSGRPFSEFRVWASGDLQPSVSLWSSDIPDQGGYTEAAHFIAFLERTYGVDRVRDISDLLGSGADPDSAFEQILAQPLTDVEQRWKDEADHMYELGPLCESEIELGADPVVIRGEIGCNVAGVLGPGPNISVDVFRGPRYCLDTPPDSVLTVVVRGSGEYGQVEARSVASEACPAHEPNLGTNVAPGEQLDFETRGCTWSVAYVSTLEGDSYEVELSISDGL